MSHSLTPLQQVWKNFRRNKLAVAGLVVISAAIVMALLGYLIMPDSTPDANNMILQLSVKKPGATFTMLRFRKSEPVSAVNFVHKMLFGQPTFFQDLPITGYHFKNDSI